MMKHPITDRRPALALLTRLRRDASGNTLAMMAAAMVPLAGLVGSGIDLGRVYATKTRLQHACDSAVLAGRKVMVGETFTTANDTLAKSFFRSNFSDKKYGTTASGISFAADKSKLTGTATATVPMSLMKIFGFTKNDIQAKCTADMNLPNTDIMMVLDTTGSMELINPGDVATRMATMRKAITDFHDSIETVKSSGTKVRYGFVPYSQTVNVGALLKPEWIADSWDYQSRVPDGVENVPGTLGTNTTYDNWLIVSGSYSDSSELLPLEKCESKTSTDTVNYQELSRTETPFAGPPAGTEVIRWVQAEQNGDAYWLEQTQTMCKQWKRSFNNYTTKWRERTIPAQGADWTRYWWLYKQVTLNTSALTVGGKITTPTGWQHASRDTVWSGCIEERATANSAKYQPLPANAYDMNIDLVPTNDPKTQWGPWLPGVEWTRQHLWNWDKNAYRLAGDTQNYEDYASGSLAICPSPSRKLAPMTAPELTTYLNNLVPAGKTYHDIGLVWGARLMSPTGLYASENGDPKIARHLIFMTDGETETDPIDYDAYGISALDRRRAADKSKVPSKDESDAEVELRFAALCEETRKKNITLWVIAFGTTLTPMLSDCASPGKAFQANNASQLNLAFQEIAKKISQLRITD